MTKSHPLRTPDVHIVIDTNALYTEAVDRLIARELSDFILHESNSLGVALHWRLPEMVIEERKQQMLNKASTLLESVQKLEGLLDHKLGYTDDTIRLHIDDTVKKQMEGHSISPLSVDTDKVDWRRVINSAAKKVAPFSPGAKEKGFKDAIILETFLQLAESLPRSPQSCRIFMLSGDGPLGLAARERIKGLRNVGLLTDLDALRTELNAIAAHLSADAISKLVERTQKMFFDDEKKTGLYYKWEIFEKINDEFSNVVSQKPAGFSTVSTKMNYISPPTFLKKEGQKVFFSSKIQRQVVAKKRVVRETAPAPTPSLPPTSENPFALHSPGANWFESERLKAEEMKLGLLSAALWETATEIEKSGSHVFEVHWCVTLNRQGRLVNPQSSTILHTSTKWDA